MLQIGDHVICRSGGVWRVADAGDGDCTLISHMTGERMALTADSAEIIRKIVSKDIILDVISRVGFIRTIQAPNDKIRREFYEEAMSRYDEIEWVRVIKTVYLRAEEKPLHADEYAYAQRAKAYLHGEISVLLDIKLDQVEDYIAAAVSSDSW